MAPAIRTRGLVKDYGRRRALHGLDLEVAVAFGSPTRTSGRSTS